MLQGCDMGGKRRKASVECVFIRGLGASSSIDTHKFIANGFDVRERISAITSLMASGAKPCAPNDPSPPKFETGYRQCL